MEIIPCFIFFLRGYLMYHYANYHNIIIFFNNKSKEIHHFISLFHVCFLCVTDIYFSLSLSVICTSF